MTILPFAAILTSIPDDTEEDEDDITHFGGEPVAVIIGEILKRHGYGVSGPDYLEHAGWELNLQEDGRRISLRVQAFGDGLNILGTHDWAVLRNFSRLRASYGKLLQRVADGLAEDTRMLKVVWYPDPSLFDIEETRLRLGMDEA